MPADPIRAADTTGWLVKAQEDLAVADLSQTAPKPLTSGTVFHAQQAPEKALKGFLTWHDRPFRKTHNLLETGKACWEIDPSLEEVARRAGPLTEYAWRFRYPGETVAPSLEEAREALALAREVFDAIVARLPEEARP